ncbi:MAG: hypothetical protein MR832_11610, partial [Clostridiales bacterium]|nr:hypothetical protein [Clostridiales bacterium]
GSGIQAGQIHKKGRLLWVIRVGDFAPSVPHPGGECKKKRIADGCNAFFWWEEMDSNHRSQ